MQEPCVQIHLRIFCTKGSGVSAGSLNVTVGKGEDLVLLGNSLPYFFFERKIGQNKFPMLQFLWQNVELHFVLFYLVLYNLDAYIGLNVYPTKTN